VHGTLTELKEWQYFNNLHRLPYTPSGNSSDHSEVLDQLSISHCDSKKMTHQWEMNNIHAVQKEEKEPTIYLLTSEFVQDWKPPGTCCSNY
jgi:hypothetical protein